MNSSIKFYYVTQIILQIWTCGQNLVTLPFQWESYHNLPFIRIWPENPFEGSSWFKINYLELALGMARTSYASVTEELKLKVRKCWGLITTFVKVTGEKLIGGLFAPYLIQDKVTNVDLKISLYIQIHIIILPWKCRILNRKNSRVIHQ